MWVFGYGSLMWDDWQTKHGGATGVLADLPGFARAFNKASTLNWGTKAAPGPTLNLVEAADGVCTGYAFEFDDAKEPEVLADLAAREGKNFKLQKMNVRLRDGCEVEAYTPMYAGKNLIAGRNLGGLVAMALVADGKDGKAADYVLNIAEKLQSVGVDDGAVTGFATEIRKARKSG